MTDTDEEIAEQVEDRLLGRGMFLQLLDEWDKIIASRYMREDEDVLFTNLPVGSIINAARIMFNGGILHTVKGGEFPKIHVVEEGMTVSFENPKGYMATLIAARTDGNGHVILQSAGDGDIDITWETGVNKVFKL